MENNKVLVLLESMIEQQKTKDSKIEQLHEDKLTLLREVSQLRLEISDLRHELENTEIFSGNYLNEQLEPENEVEVQENVLSILKRIGLLDEVDPNWGIHDIRNEISKRFRPVKDFETIRAELEKLIKECEDAKGLSGRQAEQIHSLNLELNKFKMENKVVKENMGCNGFKKDTQVYIEQLEHEISQLKGKIMSRERTIEQAKSEKKDLRDKCDLLVSENTKLKLKVSQLEEILAELRRNINSDEEYKSLRISVDTLRSSNEKKEVEIGALRLELEETQKEVDNLRAKLRKTRDEKTKLYNKNRYANQKIEKLEESIRKIQAQSVNNKYN